MPTRRLVFPVVGALAIFLAVQRPAPAQPFGAWLTLTGDPTHGYVQIPHSSQLNPTGAITLEAWVALNSVSGCRSIIGKDYVQAYWLGVCDGQLRSYFRNGSSRTGGVVPTNQWTHLAATFDGVRHKHYINGELVLDQPASGPPTTSPDPVRIGSDVSHPFTPKGSIDEVRLWGVARTQSQIRCAINHSLPTADTFADQCLGALNQTGLRAVWRLDGNAQDATPNNHDGAVGGAGVAFLTSPVAASCGSQTATSQCFLDRYLVSVKFRTGAPGAAESTAQTIGCSGSGCNNSGIFWFFSASNWEIMVKVLNGCGLNNRYWAFITDGTSVYYRLTVTDVTSGTTKVYFNWPVGGTGADLPILDTRAFATCP